MAINEKKTFEELMREKVEGHEFPFESNSWAKMQNMMQAHQAQVVTQQTTVYKSVFLKAGKIVLGVVSGSAIVYSALSLSGMLDDKKTAANENLQQQEIALQQVEDKATDKTFANTALLKLDENNTSSDAENTVANHDVKTGISAQQETAAQNLATQKSAYTSTSKNASVNKNTKHFPAGTDMEITQNSRNKETNSFGKNDKFTKAGSKVSNRDNSNSKAGNNGFAKDNTDIINALNKTAKTDVSDNSFAYNTVEKNASDAENKTVVSNETAVNKETTLQTVAPLKQENPLATETDSMLSTDPLKGGKYAQKPAAEKSGKKMHLGIYVGLNGTATSKEVDGSKVVNIDGTPSFGINTALPLGDKLAFQAGAQYLSHKISNVSYESAVVRYAILREDSIVTRTTFSQANYVEFPLLVKYGISPKWNIYAGLRTSLLLGIKANMTEEHYSNGISSSSTPIENTGKFAQFEGLRSVDFGIPLGVEFSLNRYISLSGTFNYGLTDFTRNKNFSNEQRDKHTSAQIYLIFKPF